MRLLPLGMTRFGRLGVTAGDNYDWSASSLALPTGFTFTRSGARVYLNSNSVWASAATNEPRFDFQPGRAGMLIAGARTNKVTAAKSNPADTTNCTTSGDVSGALSVVDGTVALGATFALFGANVYKVDNSAGSTAFYVRFGGTTGGTTAHSLSCFAYGAGDMLLYDGTTDTGAVAIDGAGFARFTGNNTTPANSSQQFAIKCAAGEIAYVIVPQLEAAVFASSPIVGSTGAVTVNAETATRSVTLPAGGFTAIWDFVSAPGAVAGTGQYIGELAIDGSNRCALYIQGDDRKPALFYNTGGATQSGIVYGSALTAGARHRVALRIATDNIGMCCDAGAVSTDTSATIWTGAATEYLGTSRSSSEHLFGNFIAANASATVWRPPLSDAAMQAGTTLA